jgi:hypothetical protein
MYMELPIVVKVALVANENGRTKQESYLTSSVPLQSFINTTQPPFEVI